MIDLERELDDWARTARAIGEPPALSALPDAPRGAPRRRLLVAAAAIVALVAAVLVSVVQFGGPGRDEQSITTRPGPSPATPPITPGVSGCTSVIDRTQLAAERPGWQPSPRTVVVTLPLARAPEASIANPNARVVGADGRSHVLPVTFWTAGPDSASKLPVDGRSLDLALITDGSSLAAGTYEVYVSASVNGCPDPGGQRSVEVAFGTVFLPAARPGPAPFIAPTNAAATTAGVSQPAVEPTVHVALVGPPRDNAQAIVTGAGFAPQSTVQIRPCIPNTDCGAYDVLAVVRTDSNGAFQQAVTLRSRIGITIDPGSGGSAFCAHDCLLVAQQLPATANVGATTEAFDLASFPTSSRPCTGGDLTATYLTRPPGASGTDSAVIGLRNRRQDTCWLFGAPMVQLTARGQTLAIPYTEVTATGAPTLVELQPGESAAFSEVRAKCTPGGAEKVSIFLSGDNVQLQADLPASITNGSRSICVGRANSVTTGFFSMLGR